MTIYNGFKLSRICSTVTLRHLNKQTNEKKKLTAERFTYYAQAAAAATTKDLTSDGE